MSGLPDPPHDGSRSTAVPAVYVDAAFAKMREVALRAGRHLNERPLGPGTNSIAALVFHCTEMTEFWLGHVGLGRPSTRDRDSEFGRVLSPSEVGRVIERARADAAAELAALGAGRGTSSELRAFLPADGSDTSLVLHVVEELYQHLGHMESTLDALALAGVVPEPLFHLALSPDWEAAQRSGGPYEVSTIGRTLAQVGFIHCSFTDQVRATAERFYAGRDDVVLLEIDPVAVAPILRIESAVGGREGEGGHVDQFPHLYGPLPLDAVISAEPYRPDTDRPASS